MNGYDPTDPYGMKKRQQPGLNVPFSPSPGAVQALGNQPPQAPEAGSMSAAEQAQIAALLGTYGDQMELGGLDEQMARAEALRNAPTPEGRQAGRVYVAANPLEHLGRGITQYRQGKRMQDIEGKRGEIRGRIGENVKLYGEKALKDL